MDSFQELGQEKEYQKILQNLRDWRIFQPTSHWCWHTKRLWAHDKHSRGWHCPDHKQGRQGASQHNGAYNQRFSQIQGGLWRFEPAPQPTNIKNVFLQMDKGVGTFDDMAIEKAKKPMRLFTQHFMLRKPPKYTRPNLRIAHCMSLVAAEISQPRPNFSKLMLGNMIQHAKSGNINKEPYLYASQMLMHVAYQAVRMADQLPKPLAQVGVPQRPMRLQRGKKQIEEVDSDSCGDKAGYNSPDIPKDFETSTSIPEHLRDQIACTPKSGRGTKRTKSWRKDFTRFGCMKNKSREKLTKHRQDSAVQRAQEEWIDESQEILRQEKKFTNVG